MRELIAAVNPSLWSEISAGVFLAGFCLLLAWVYWPARRGSYQRAERLPIEDD